MDVGVLLGGSVMGFYGCLEGFLRVYSGFILMFLWFSMVLLLVLVSFWTDSFTSQVAS